MILKYFFFFFFHSEEDSAMVFVSNEVGEHSITTRDLSVNENTVIQFEVLILRKLLGILLRAFCSLRFCSSACLSGTLWLPGREAFLISPVIILILLSLLWVYPEAFITQIRKILPHSLLFSCLIYYFVHSYILALITCPTSWRVPTGRQDDEHHNVMKV